MMSFGKYTVMCNNLEHPVIPWLRRWIANHPSKEYISLVHSPEEINWNGDFLFLISYSRMVGDTLRARFGNTLVFHPSNLPKGRGWSPQVWEIIAGADTLTLSMIEAADPVDSGKIWSKRTIPVAKTALYDEINALIFTNTIELMDQIIIDPNSFSPEEQDIEIEPTFYRRRSPKDSALDIEKPLKDQFNLLRICDPERYPAFFEFEGQKYILTIRKAPNGGS